MLAVLIDMCGIGTKEISEIQETPCEGLAASVGPHLPRPRPFPSRSDECLPWPTLVDAPILFGSPLERSPA